MTDPLRPRSTTAIRVGQLLAGTLWILFPEIAIAQPPFSEGVRSTDPLTAEEQLKTFEVPEGFKVELVSAEPDILKPLNLNFDYRGRLWVTDSTEYPFPAPESTVARDSVKILEDTDGDGRYDKTTVFAEELNIPIGIYPTLTGCIVYSIPHIWLLEDTDGDDRADRKTRLYGPMGYERDTHGMNNAFTRGFDGWLYACHGFNNETRVAGRDQHEIHMQSGNTYRMRLDGDRIEQFTWGQVNPFGMTIDNLGNLFTADCHSKPVYQLIRGGYYPSFGKPHDGLGYVPAIMEHLHGSTAIAGVSLYVDNRFPAPYRQNLFSGNVMTSRINRNRLDRNGATPTAVEQPDFLSTTDPWYRPVDIQLGPDGALYVADFYNRIIGHYEVPLEHPGRDRFRGRIWRVSYSGTKDAPATRKSTFQSLEGRSDSDLIQGLADPNLTARLLVLNYLVDRSLQHQNHHDPTQLCQLALTAFQDSPNPHQRSAILWVLARLGWEIEKVASRGLADDHPEVRTHALRVLAESNSVPPNALLQTVRALEDPAPEVRLAAADVLGQHTENERIKSLLAALDDVKEGDFLLRQGLRIAVKQQLLSQTGWFPTLANEIDENRRDLLANIAIAVPTAESASLILDQIQRDSALPPSELTPRMRHIALHANAQQLETLSTLVPSKFPEHLDIQFEILAAIESGLRERGQDPLPVLETWGKELTDRFLTRVHPDPTWDYRAIAGKTRQDNPWVVQSRISQDGATHDFLCSLPAGEQATGELVSKPFPAPRQLTFFLAGHDGFPNQPVQNQNLVRLLDVETGDVLREVNPPRNDTAQKVVWALDQLENRQVQLSILDRDQANAYAWLAIGRFEPGLVKVPAIGPREHNSDLQNMAQLVRRLKLASHRPILVRNLLRAGSDGATRKQLATAALTLQPEVHLQAMLPVLSDSSPSPEWVARYAEQLEHPDHDACRTFFDETLASLPGRLQTQVAQQLSSNREGASLLLELIQNAKVSRRIISSEQIAQTMRANMTPSERQTLNELSQSIPDGHDLAKQIEERRGWISHESADPVAGAAVFKKHCANCHQIAGQGAMIGPQLDGIGNRGLERLMEDLLDPNRNVDVAFRTTLIQTEDGATESGLIRQETETSIRLIDSQGKELLIDKNQVEQRQPSPLSLMPGNLVSDLPRREFVNLIGYLLKPSHP